MNISGTGSSLAFYLALLLSVAAPAAPAQDAAPRTWNVANNGLDGSTCGGRDSPCRTINWALARAQAGDFILVGPGIYGEFDGDDDAPRGDGEEGPIHLDKAVRLLSREGAARTVFAAASEGVDTAVTITADGVRFGLADHGFTVRSSDFGIRVVGASRVWIIDNIFEFNRDGIIVEPDLASGRESSECVLIGNQAVRNGEAFSVRGNGHYLELNVARDSNFGFGIGGNGTRMINNSAIGNQEGGVVVGGSNHVLFRNEIISTMCVGVRVLPQSSGIVIRQNNIYGNDDHCFLGAQNIGLVNGSGSLVRATDNFWGSATGPGPNPADEVFTENGSETRVVPFAAEPWEIRLTR
jgi:hypothetical protein